MKPDGSGERILTEGFHNESPTWAPNGQYIMFFRDPGGQAGGKLYMVDITGRVEQPVPTPSFASDPTWSPLLLEARTAGELTPASWKGWGSQAALPFSAPASAQAPLAPHAARTGCSSLWLRSLNASTRSAMPKTSA